MMVRVWNQKKIQAILEWPVPTNPKGVRGFLDLTGYYRKFICGYAMIASPLTDLLRKDAFRWSLEAEQAFMALQSAITTAPVLQLPEFNKIFILETYASGFGIGSVLLQDQTDQKSIQGLLDQVIQTPEQHHYLDKLLGYSYTIEYKPGVENGVADALSQRPVGEPAVSKFLTLSTIHLKYIQKLQELNLSDPFLVELHKKLNDGLLNQAEYTVKDGLLLFKGKLLIGRDPHLIQEILREFHCSPVGGHFGVRKTMTRVNQTFTWPTMKQDVTDFIKGCYICQRHKAVTTKPAGLLQPLPPPKAIWEEITIDFVTGLPPSHGDTVIFVVVDRLSKQAYFGTLPTSFTASKIAELFAEIV
ncbi:ty3-gypsy retrotransposon protein [Tanacetum coccineum]